MRKVIFQYILIFSLVVAKEKPYVLMVSFDGFHYDYVNWVDTPNFDYIAKHRSPRTCKAQATHDALRSSA